MPVGRELEVDGIRLSPLYDKLDLLPFRPVQEVFQAHALLQPSAVHRHDLVADGQLAFGRRAGNHVRHLERAGREPHAEMPRHDRPIVRLRRPHPFAVGRFRGPEPDVRGVKLAGHEVDDARENGIAGGMPRRRQVPVPHRLPVDAVHASVVEPVAELRPCRAESELAVVGQVVLAVDLQAEDGILVRRLVVHRPRKAIVLLVPARVASAPGRQLFARHAVRDVQRKRGRAAAVGERTRIVREERRVARYARAPDTVEKPVEHDVHVRCALLVRPGLLLVLFLVPPANVPPDAPNSLRLVLGLVFRVEIDVVDLVAAVASSRPIPRPGEQLAVRAPCRRAVPFPVPRQVVRLPVARGGDDPHVAVVVRVHEFRHKIARVRTPGDGAGRVRLRAPFGLHVLQRHHVDVPSLVRAGEASAVRRKVQPGTDRAV